MEKTVSILVLGDIGRSPRMQYHAYSFLKRDYKVQLIGYLESRIFENLMNERHLTVLPVKTLTFLNYLPTIFRILLKSLWLFFSLIFTLLKSKHSNYFLVQNPPCFPSLVVVYLLCKIRGTVLICDWHNYTWSFEFFLGRLAHKNICVSKAMREDLWIHNIHSSVLYDRPHEKYKKLQEYERKSLKKTFLSKTRLQFEFDFELAAKENCAFLISSTSWTIDEKFDTLLDALIEYDEIKNRNVLNIPTLLVVITGKGHLKSRYENTIKNLRLKNITFIMPWLSEMDYIDILAACDLGVCLHASTSKLDLPMKVLDMFGSNLPVLALNYDCLDELVINEYNGYTFETSHDLCIHIMNMLSNFPNNSSKLNQIRDNIEDFLSTETWDSNWNNVMKNILID
ncbi:Beta-1,4-mannosyltransferase [Intoshia linei]|uniref:Beta-1,4-mannosyltransferase n=1 Tax=Intoshia linei TaxID=1819745 RepID=A0A177B9N7_9BILA|nr:Beta-1,4-mannosyltransferase [Intoshia linei]